MHKRANNAPNGEHEERSRHDCEGCGRQKAHSTEAVASGPSESEEEADGRFHREQAGAVMVWMVNVRVDFHSDELEQSEEHDHQCRQAADSIEYPLGGQVSFPVNGECDE